MMMGRPIIAAPHESDRKKMNHMEVDKFERFEQWLRDCGAQFDMLELREYETHNGSAQSNQPIDVDVSEEKKELSAKEGSDVDSSKLNSNGSSGSSGGGCSGSGGGGSSGSIGGRGYEEGEELGEESEMRGVHAVMTIPPNTTCMSIPRKCLITVEMGQATEIGQAILNSDLDLDAPKHIFLMIYLLWDRKVNANKSFFKPYYDILPQTLKNMPIFWSGEELSFLDGSYLLAQIADRNDAITDDYHAICEVAPDLARIATLDDFKWARMCVCSRNFGLQIDGHRTSALVPHADMLNHYRPRETKWTFDDERQAFTITTLQTIPSGAQVYDSYGQKCNHRFLLNYGFAVEDNREIDGFCPNEVPIELGIMPDDPTYDAKHEFWTRDESPAGAAVSSLYHGGSGVAALTAALSAAAAAGRGNRHSPTSMSADVTAADVFSPDAGATNKNNTSAIKTSTTAAAVAAAMEKARSCSFSGNSPDSTMPVIKRVRICVSNNENTRILFSMLRVLATNEVELRAISATPTPPTTTSFGSDAGYMSRALLALSPSAHVVGNTASTNTTTNNNNNNTTIIPPPGTFCRTCRDIRHPLNLRNERAAMEHLLNVIRRSLALYPTTLAQDVADLLNEMEYPRFSNKRHAKIQVRGEKEVLHHFAQWARTALDVMEVIQKELAMERGELNEERKDDNGDDDDDVLGLTGFDFVIRAMEEESVVGQGGLHHTIVRYCADVLGSLRREEMKNIRRTLSNGRTGLGGGGGFV